MGPQLRPAGASVNPPKRGQLLGRTPKGPVPFSGCIINGIWNVHSRSSSLSRREAVRRPDPSSAPKPPASGSVPCARVHLTRRKAEGFLRRAPGAAVFPSLTAFMVVRGRSRDGPRRPTCHQEVRELMGATDRRRAGRLDPGAVRHEHRAHATHGSDSPETRRSRLATFSAASTSSAPRTKGTTTLAFGKFLVGFGLLRGGSRLLIWWGVPHRPSPRRRRRPPGLVFRSICRLRRPSYQHRADGAHGAVQTVGQAPGHA